MPNKLFTNHIREILDEFIPEEAFETLHKWNVTVNEVADAGFNVDTQVAYNSYLFRHSYEYEQELQALEREEFIYRQKLISEFHPGVR